MALNKKKAAGKLFYVTDIFIIAALLVLAAGFFVFFSPLAPSGENVSVYKNGVLLGNYPLNKDAVIYIGEKNELTVKNGRAFMSASECPGHLCEKQNIGITGSIICLPNRVVVVLTGESSGFDAVTGGAG